MTLETKHERQPWFVRDRKWDISVIVRIRVLKRHFGLDRCRDPGKSGSDKRKVRM
jgi:hypothetical protein